MHLLVHTQCYLRSRYLCRPEVMDPAVLRPGRFGKVLYVPLPSSDERQLILKALAQKKPISADVDLEALACTEQCNNLTGADLAALVRFTHLFPFPRGFIFIELLVGGMQIIAYE